MNANFKPLGLAAAVATATAGYAGVVNAQAELAGNTQLGDLAIVPYYTVMEGYATGVNIINTSDRTQALKVRFRRAVDSMDALDFNIVLSPYDMYTGYIELSGSDIKFVSNDNSCTAPALEADNSFTMPNIFREGAETGYIEIMSMGSPVTEAEPVAIAAKHTAAGVPADCAAVRDNFFILTPGVRGVEDSTTTWQAGVTNTWEASPDSLKVSYFIKSDVTGVEFGNNAVHIANFFDGPAMTNQQRGVGDGDLLGFNFPNLNGGSPIGMGASTGLYEDLRNTLGAETLLNDWSQNSTATFSVDTDWVVTIPGQYLMMDLGAYYNWLQAGNAPEDCLDTTTLCDYRDIPMTAYFTVYDREEQGIVVDPGDLVVSPQPPEEIQRVELDKEVNVISWGVSPVLNAPSNIIVEKPPGAAFGWAALEAESEQTTPEICDWDTTSITNDLCAPTTTPAPIIGFAAWQRAFTANPGSNYGRIVEHSRVQSSS